MEKDYLIDGDNKLNEQEDSLNFAQDLAAALVTKYKAIDADPKINLQHPNVATLTSLAIGGKVKPIKLVKVSDLSTPAGLKAIAGLVLVFTGEVYINGKLASINAYR